MAALILNCGAPKNRLALPSSRIIIHQPWVGAQGQARDIGIKEKEILRLKKMTIEYFAKHSDKSIEKVSADMERDFFMSAADAVEYGIVDRILTREKHGAAS
jgi:ATP-dependent Clp protease protease subunit